MIKPSLRASLPPDLLALDSSVGEAFYRQIYTRFRNAIADRLLKPGARIPSARALAEELGVARGTVEAAYSLLTAEGYVETRGQAGTIVTLGLKPGVHATPTMRHRTVAAPTADSPAPISMPMPFQMGLPALDAFPRKIWSRLAARSIRATAPGDMIYPPQAGVAALRREIATYLQLSRGVACTPEQVFVTSGYRETLQLITGPLLKPGDKVWTEDPGYQPTGQVLIQAGMTPVPVPVDGEGLQVALGMQEAPRARAAIVTPAHQSPLCVSLSLQRRFALLDWAARANAWIVEDDYDGEYRYVGRPLPALKSLDRDGRVLYAGTFSKVLFPGIRLAYLVVPESQIERFAAAGRTMFSGSPVLTQNIVSDFIAEGHFARHVQRMRKLYGERRKIAADGLDGLLGTYLRVDPQPGGMHLILRVRGRRSDKALAAAMRKDGMFVHALSQRAVRYQTPPALLLSFTNIDSAATMEALGRRILKLLEA
ncbi:transcriptional regulator with HTH domain and aminotransferase domain containing protein [Herbaspirillum sp. CF444]|uniref:MocR-like pyridoxine biosynthesis transcription factor PdxR n=1 Tax=Herbaspirillum sp. CF444 TaxID=1144319 RepID=UPI000272734C|nr:PLP-dependent aminotransferase family protein [Herbaspirillum sp. CF444]EJL93454.1 transcriptional regulator with HTH domain and aminotransferase domain containing protein [Herbaspirillum sp. CF444]